MDIEALVGNISDVSSSSTEESHSLVAVSLEWSDDSIVSVSSEIGVLNALINRDNSVSIGVGSDSSGSPVEGPPLLVVSWVVVLDSQSVLTSTDVLVPEEGSVLGHS